MARLATSTRAQVLISNRQRLLETAASEFAQKGFAAANINQISIAAGFAKGTIYNYFSSKRGLMLALIDEFAVAHTQFIVNQVEPEETPIQKLTRFFSAGFAFVEQHPDQSRIAINVVYGHDEAFKKRIYAAYEDLFSLIIEHIIAAGVAQGEFKPVDADLTAALLMSIYLGGCSQLDVNGKIWFDPEQVAAFVLQGLQQR